MGYGIFWSVTGGMQAEPTQGFGHSKRRILVEIGLIVGGLVGLVLLVFWLAGVTAGALVRFIPVSADRALGELAWSGMVPADRRCTNPALVAWLDSITAPLVENLEDERFQFQIAIVDDPTPNAFALPGGFMAVNRGLLELAESSEEVAGVIGHELHHVTLRHGFRRIVRQAGGYVVLGLIFGYGDVGMLAGYAGDLVSSGYDRDQEREADAGAHRLLVQTGLGTAGLASFFTRMLAESGDAGALQFISTHPALAERAETARALAQGHTPTRTLPPLPDPIVCR